MARTSCAFSCTAATPFDRVELGEEPDGQYVTPEDYASLYLRWARALRGIAPHAAARRPELPESRESQVMMAWPEDSAGAPWMTRFLSVLRKRESSRRLRLSLLRVVSVRRRVRARQRRSSRPLLVDSRKRSVASHDQGVPRTLPLIIAEYGYSAFASRAEVDIEAALFDADLVGHFLSLGGSDRVSLRLRAHVSRSRAAMRSRGGTTRSFSRRAGATFGIRLPHITRIHLHHARVARARRRAHDDLAASPSVARRARFACSPPSP